MSEKVVVIGLDAACFERIESFLQSGELPNLQRLLEEGGGTDLETTTPPWTPSAWPSVVTGTKPSTHGIYDFFDYDAEYDSELVSARDLETPYLWEHLSELGLGSIIVNVPVTHPAQAIEGSLVPGYLSPESPACVVDGDVQRLSDVDEEYRIYARSNEPTKETIREYECLIESRAEMAKGLADRHEWSFLMTQFQRTDSVYHTFGDDEAAARRVYRAVDEAIGSLLDHLDDECNVLVVSDHGIWQYESVFYVNAWLRDEGFLETTNESQRVSWNEATKNQLKADDGEGGSGRSMSARALGQIAAIAGKLGVRPHQIEPVLRRLHLDGLVRKALPQDVLEESLEHVDWQRSNVYCRSVSSLGLRFNVEGREADGTVPREAFAEKRAELIAALEDLTGPHGRPVFDDVRDRHEVWGTDLPNEPSAPDILLRPNDMRWEISDIVKATPFETTTAFNHNYEGLLIAAGPDITWADGITPHVTDIAPTILALLGIRPPESMDGNALGRLLSDEPTEPAPTTLPERNYLDADGSASGDGVVEERLQDMGYLE